MNGGRFDHVKRHEDRSSRRRRHRPGDRRAGGQGTATRCSATGSSSSSRKRRSAARASTRTAIRCRSRRSSSRRQPTRCCAAPSAVRKYDALPRPQRPEQGILRIRKELGLFANLRPAVLYPGAGRRVDAQAGSGVGARHHDHARADRRHLLRRAARAARERARRARRLRHDALFGARDPAHRRGRLPDGAEARQEALLGRQGERARDEPLLARGRERRREEVPGRSRSRTCTSTTPRCSSCAIRSSST